MGEEFPPELTGQNGLVLADAGVDHADDLFPADTPLDGDLGVAQQVIGVAMAGDDAVEDILAAAALVEHDVAGFQPPADGGQVDVVPLVDEEGGHAASHHRQGDIMALLDEQFQLVQIGLGVEHSHASSSSCSGQSSSRWVICRSLTR